MKTSTPQLLNPVLKAGLICTALIFSAINANAQTELASLDFDGGGIGFTTTSDFTNGTGHFSDTDGSTISNVSGSYSFEGGGNIFWAAENTDAGGGLAEQRLTTDDFSINGFADIKVCIDMAAGNEQLGDLGTYDKADFVFVQYNTDMQPLYRDALSFQWKPNSSDVSDLVDEPLHHDVNRNGDGSDGPQITTTAQNFCYTIPNSHTSDVSATMMSIRLLVSMNGEDEEIAFDNIVVTSADVTPPTVTCTEFTGSGNSCPALHDPNTPNGSWNSVPASGTFGSAVGGGVVSGTINLNGCVTDDFSALDEMEYTLLSSFQENVTTCSKDIINEYQIRDATGNVSPTTFRFRGTITYDGPAPMINCPADANLEYGVIPDPKNTGMATATSGCGNPLLSYVDGVTTGDSNPRGEGTIFIRTWTATDGCGKTATCDQTIFMAPSNIPTMSQWALLMLGMTLMSMALVTMRNSIYSRG